MNAMELHPQPQQMKLDLRPLEDTVDVSIAAIIAKTSPETMRRWCDEGRVDAVKPGGRWRVYRKPLLEMIERRRNAYRQRSLF